MNRITIELTVDQAYAIIRDIENENIDRPGGSAYERRIVTKIEKALAKAKTL